MPESIQMTEMKALDSIAINGTFWVRASTFGRGIWQREISGDDATAGLDPVVNHSLANLYPPYFNANANSLECNYQLSFGGKVEIAIFDLFGREIGILVNETQSAGNYSVNKSMAGFASGAYLCRLRLNEKILKTEKFIITR